MRVRLKCAPVRRRPESRPVTGAAVLRPKPERGTTQGPPPGYVDNTRNTVCNAVGFFTFDRVADGEYFVQSSVTWTVGGRDQGGALMQRVTVRGAQLKEVKLSP